MVTENFRSQATATQPFERSTETLRQSAAEVEPTTAERVGPPSETRPRLELRHPLRTVGVMVSWATLGAIAGLTALVLSILGFVQIATAVMVSVATIVLGVAFVFLAGMGQDWASMFRLHERETRFGWVWYVGGAIFALLAGTAGILLGIVSLTHPGAGILGAVMAIVFGAALLRSITITRHARSAEYGVHETHIPAHNFSRFVMPSALFAQFVTGAGAIILGVLAIVGLAPAVLVLVSMLAIGVTVALVSTAICGATLAALQRYYPEP